MTRHRKNPASLPNDIGQGNVAHPLARALFALRLDLKALAATLSEDDAIAHPSGIQINHTEFHVDALSAVRGLGVSLTQACFSQIFECFRFVHQGNSPEIAAALRAIRIYLDQVADQLRSPEFTNGRRIIAFLQSDWPAICVHSRWNISRSTT